MNQNKMTNFYVERDKQYYLISPELFDTDEIMEIEQIIKEGKKRIEAQQDKESTAITIAIIFVLNNKTVITRNNIVESLR